MIIFCSFLIFCCSLVQSWEIHRDVISPEAHNLRKDASPEDSNNSPETVTVERIIKSSVYPREDEGKSSPVFSHVGPGNVNTTIRLKFVKTNQAGEPLDYDLTQDIKSNEHHSHTEEMSSQKIILYNQTKTQDEESKTSSKHLLQQLHNLKWPVNDENETDLKDGTVQKAVLVNYKDVTPVVKKEKTKEEVVSQKEKGGRSTQNLDEKQALLEKITEYLEARGQTTATETPADKRYRISEPQMELLNLLYKLVQSKEITYDFINRLIYLFHTHGYQNQLLQVLFDFIIKQLQSQGNSEDQQKTLNNLMEVWNVLYRLQGESRDDLDKNKEIKADKPSSEESKVLKLLLLLDALKESNNKGKDVLRSNYLNELRSLYNSFDNKNDLMRIIHNHLIKQQQDKNKPPSREKIPPEIPGHGIKQEGVNQLIQSLFKLKDLDNNKKVLVDHDKKKPSLGKIIEEKSGESPNNARWKALVELLSQNKQPSSKKPHDLLVMQKIIEDVEDDDRAGEPPMVDTGKRMKIKKRKKKPSRSDNKERTERMYQILLELLQSSKIRNNEELKVQIIEMLRKIQLQKDDDSDESDQGDQGDLVTILDRINKQKNKPEDTETCVVGTSWTVDCQNCICVAEGVPVCKRIPECVIGSKLDKPMQCKPHSKFRLDACNTCKCNSVGIPICTLMECDESVLRDSVSKKFLPEQEALKAILCPPERKIPVCAPRTSWRGDCYDCVCDEDGQRHCNLTKNCKFVSLGKGKVAPAGQTSS